jgi:hypothetical protein
MELREFRDTIYGKYKKYLFKFETTWDSFRPISFVGWNGDDFVAVDSEYKQDIFSPHYGYGSQQMKDVCKQLTLNTELGNVNVIIDPVDFWKWCGQTGASWWRDRPCVFASRCVSRNISDWKRYVSHLHSKPRTLRRNMLRHKTKRLVPK